MKKILLSLVALFAIVSQSFAGSTWYAYYASLTGSPSGAGKVYISHEETTPTFENESQELQFVAGSGEVYLYAQPVAGKLLAGFTAAKYDEESSNYVELPGFVALNSGESFTLESTATDDPDLTGESDSATVAASKMPMDPQYQITAHFATVIARYAAGQDSLGTITVSPLDNNAGDKVTLTAVPDETFKNCKFDHWALNGQTVSTEATFEVTAGDAAKYVAYFTSDDAELVDFGKGTYRVLPLSEENDVMFPSNVHSLDFNSDNFSISKDASTVEVSLGNFNAPALKANVLYGEGEATLVTRKADYPYADEYTLNRYAAEATAVSALDKSAHYYKMDTDAQMLKLLADDATIDANSFYVALPDTVWNDQKEVDPVGLAAAPEYITFGTDVPTLGISNVTVADEKKVAVKGIYTLDGRRVDAMREQGLYIVDGKKVLYIKK